MATSTSNPARLRTASSPSANALVKTTTSAASESQSARLDVLVVVENRDLHAGDLIRIARVMTGPP